MTAKEQASLSSTIISVGDIKHNSSIRSAFVYAILITVMGVVLSASAYFFSYNIALIQLHERNSERLLETVTSLRNEIAQYQDLPHVLAQNHNINRYLRYFQQQTAKREQNEMNRYLEQINSIAGTSSLLLLDGQGKAVAYSNWWQDKESNKQQTRISAEGQLFEQVLLGDSASLFWANGSSDSAYYLAAPVRFEQRFIGAVIVRIDVVKLKRQLAFAYDYYVSDHQRRLLFANIQIQAGNSDNLLVTDTHWRTLSDGRKVALDYSLTQPRLHQWVRLDDLTWQVGLMSPLEQVTQVATITAGVVAGGYLALVLLSLYLREYYQKQLSREKVIQTQIESERRQRHIINNAQVGLLSVDNKGHIVFANTMFMQQFSAKEAALINRKLADLLTDDENNQVVRESLEHLDRGVFKPLLTQEASLRRLDGGVVPVLFSVQQVVSRQQTFYLVTILDITKRKSLEYKLLEVNHSLEQQVEQRTADLKLAQAELVQAEKLAALGRMSTGVVHELNQPLTAMRNYTAIVNQINDSPELVSDNVKQINVLIDRMASITGQLKSFAYKNSQSLVLLDLAMVVEKVVSLFEPRFQQEQVSCEVNIAHSQVNVMADQVRLEQVLTNLLENACQAMAGEAEPSTLIINLTIESEQAVVTVIDNGPGVSKQQAEHLFEPFYTTKPMGQGLGLGLAIVHSIINDLAGKMLVQYNQAGFTIGFRLPLAQGDKS